MTLSDIFQIMLLCAVVFLPLGYLTHGYLTQGVKYWKNRLLRPRYLKSEGVWMRDDATSQAKK